jgi:hypothetical protein
MRGTNNFDKAIRTFSGFPGYQGNPATTEAEFNALFGEDNPWENKPTWAQIQVAMEEAKKASNKEEAKKRIATTDWAVLPDVGLANVAAFETYRAALRELIKNPVAEPVWPTEPTPIWS